jgi:hypothetical protein
MSVMQKVRWPVAAVLIALLAGTSSDAEAGKGRLARDAAIERDKGGRVVFREKATHRKGLRSRIPLLNRGKMMTNTNEQSHDGVKSTIQRGRHRVTKATQANGAGGTKATSTYEKKGLISRKWRSKMLRTDSVAANQVNEDSSQKRMFRGWQDKPSRQTGRMGNTVERLVNGEQRAVDPSGKAFRGRLKGRRAIERRPDSMEIADTQPRRWGVLRLLGNKKKRVTVEQRQTPDGMKVTMTTPRTVTTRDTKIGDGFTTSTGSYSKKGKVRERDDVTATRDGVVRRTEKLRRDGSVDKIITERVAADGRTRVTTKSLRDDGSVKKIKERESFRRADGKKGWQRSRTTYRRDGSVRTNIGIGKVDGKWRANVKTPIGSVGQTKSRITTRGPGPAQMSPDDE